MKIITLDMRKVRLLTLDSNREVAEKRLISNIKANGIGVPPIVVKASEFAEENLKLHTLLSGKHVTPNDISDDDYIIIDGQHRLSAVQHLNLDSDGDDIPQVEVILYSKENLHGKTLPEFIANINSSGKRWSRGDFIHMTANEKPDDLTIKIISQLKLAGLSPSSIGRYLAFNNKSITETSLTDYMNGDVSAFETFDCGRGLQLLNLLFKLGFKYMFIKKRYMIDYIIGENRHGRLGKCIEMLSHLSHEQVVFIENMPADTIDSAMGKKLTLITQEDNDNGEAIGLDEKLLSNGNEVGIEIPSDDAEEGLHLFNSIMGENKTVPKKIRDLFSKVQSVDLLK